MNQKSLATRGLQPMATPAKSQFDWALAPADFQCGHDKDETATPGVQETVQNPNTRWTEEMGNINTTGLS